MTPRKESFKKELQELLKKYNAYIEIKEPESYIESHKVVVIFDSIWDNNANICVNESEIISLGYTFTY